MRRLIVRLVSPVAGLALLSLAVYALTGRARDPQRTEQDGRLAVTGRVVDAQGRGVHDATVAVTHETDDHALLAAATTDAEGRFVARLAPTRARLVVRATKSGFVPSAPRVLDPASARDPLTAQLVLSPGHRVTGVVRESGGPPIGDARVWLAWGDATIETRSAIDGRYALDGLPRDVHVRCEAASFGPAVRRFRGTEPTLDFTLHPEIGVAGDVTCAGRPVPAFRVTLRPHAPDAASRSEDGTDGRFAVGGLAPGRYDVVVGAAGFLQAQPLAIRAEPGLPPLRIDMVRAPDVAISVIDARSRAPIEAADVELGGDARGRTGRDGRLAMARPDGPHTVRVTKEGYTPASEKILVAGERVERTIELRASVRASLALWGCGLRVRVRDASGRTVFSETCEDSRLGLDLPAEGLYTIVVGEAETDRYVEHVYRLSLGAGDTVNVDPTDYGLDRYRISGTVRCGGVPVVNAIVQLGQARQGMTTEHLVRTTSTGEFAIPGVAAGAGRLTVKSVREGLIRNVPDYEELVTIDRDLELAVSLQGAALRVAATVDGQPAAGAVVLLYRVDDASALLASATAGLDGRAEIPNLRDGLYAIEVGGPSYGPSFQGGISLARDEVRDVAAALRRGTEARGTLSSSSGPLAGAAIHLADADSGRVYASKFAVTDGSGRFAIPNVPAGAWKLQIAFDGQQRFTPTIEFPRGELALQW